MPDHVLEQIVGKSRDARNGGFDALSTGEKLVTALVLNRADWLADMGYTMAEAIDRVSPDWLIRVHDAAVILTEDD
ncbi:hypothetical protein [Xanthomonas sp. NCPPB 2632]|uniref:hypothetical protein n=1 Tax=Xanthomonas sp. NCPPB 2632 TaxID=3240912 RepID=UPI003514BFAE